MDYIRNIFWLPRKHRVHTLTWAAAAQARGALAGSRQSARSTSGGRPKKKGTRTWKEICTHIYLSICLSIYLSIHLSIERESMYIYRERERQICVCLYISQLYVYVYICIYEHMHHVHRRLYIHGTRIDRYLSHDLFASVFTCTCISLFITISACLTHTCVSMYSGCISVDTGIEAFQVRKTPGPWQLHSSCILGILGFVRASLHNAWAALTSRNKSK